MHSAFTCAVPVDSALTRRLKERLQKGPSYPIRAGAIPPRADTQFAAWGGIVAGVLRYRGAAALSADSTKSAGDIIQLVIAQYILFDIRHGFLLL